MENEDRRDERRVEELAGGHSAGMGVGGSTVVHRRRTVVVLIEIDSRLTVQNS